MDDRRPRVLCTHLLHPLGHAPPDVSGMLTHLIGKAQPRDSGAIVSKK